MPHDVQAQDRDCCTVQDVTAVVVTHRRPQMVVQAVRSALGQVGGPLQVLVVDDSSGDGTGAALAQLDGIRVITTDRQLGVCGARNLGLGEVRTPWVAFLDDDDLWAPDKIFAQLEAIHALDGCRWCYAAVMVVDADLRQTGAHRPGLDGDVATALRSANHVLGGGSGVLAHAETVRAVGGFDPRMRHVEDWDLWMRLADVSPVAAVDRPLVAYRVHGSNVSSDPCAAGWRELHAKHRGDAAGAAVPTGPSDKDLRGFHLREGRRRPAATAFLRAAVRDRSAGLLVGALLALVSPALLRRLQGRAWRRRTPASWYAEVEAWLRPLQGDVAPRA